MDLSGYVWICSTQSEPAAPYFGYASALYAVEAQPPPSSGINIIVMMGTAMPTGTFRKTLVISWWISNGMKEKGDDN